MIEELSTTQKELNEELKNKQNKETYSWKELLAGVGAMAIAGAKLYFLMSP